MAALPVHVTAALHVELDELGATPDAVELSITAGQEIVWYCWDPQKSLKVTFDQSNPGDPKYKGSPFDHQDFTVRPGKTEPSGPPRRNAPLGLYRYSICRPGSPVPLSDPEIIIKG